MVSDVLHNAGCEKPGVHGQDVMGRSGIGPKRGLNGPMFQEIAPDDWHLPLIYDLNIMQPLMFWYQTSSGFGLDIYLVSFSLVW